MGNTGFILWMLRRTLHGSLGTLYHPLGMQQSFFAMVQGQVSILQGVTGNPPP